VPPSFTDRNGPPWEQSGPALQTWIDTAKAVLTDTVVAFNQMRREGGLVGPLTYYLVGLAVGMIGTVLWQLVGIGRSPMAGVGALSLLILIPVCGTIGLFIISFLVHFALGLFGGQKYPYEVTFRTLAYAFGSTQPIGLVPICGGVIALVWGLVVAIMGLAQMQETTTGKAAGGVLAPMVLCCGLVVVFWGMLIALFIGGAAAAGMSH
jgi:hypothetical protein